MKNLRCIVYALNAAAAAALLCGCGVLRQAQDEVPPAGASRALRQGTSSSYQVLYRFHHRANGAAPVAGLIDVGGALYGTTVAGGLSGKGTVYRVSTDGKQEVIYRFRGGADGQNPQSELIDVNGTFYGTTAYGGSSESGIVYSVTTDGVEKVVYTFKGGSDGAHPVTSLLELNGTLYGTTRNGGTGCAYEGGCGTVFSIDASGNETVLHRFTGGSDGAYAVTALIDVKGTLYGTTGLGGICKDYGGCGTVYSISTSGSEKVLYSFQAGSDGDEPNSLIDVNGILYGTTNAGGQAGQGCDQAFYCGTVFSITTKGVENVVYRFTGGTDGDAPDAALVNVNKVLYGTTSEGGQGGVCHVAFGNCGTLFSVTTAGVETVLHRFAAGSDGWAPTAPLVDVNGTLYGTTDFGGGAKCENANGCGTVFALTP